jgi:hypothetical protein
LKAPKSWIFCEKQLHSIDEFELKNWQERLFFERLERKSKQIEELLLKLGKDWEALLFCLLAKNFGLNTNGETFLRIAQSIPFSILRKESFELENLEALFFAKAGLLSVDKEDRYFKELRKRYVYMSQKYQMEEFISEPVQFFKHRPDNFPTIRLSQLANLYHSQQNLFSKLIQLNSIQGIYEIFKMSVSSYWQNHYQFDKESPKKKKALTKSFIDLLVINTIIPLQFSYAKSQGKEISEDVIQLMQQVVAEKNSVVTKFDSFGIQSKNALDTQSLLQLKNEYCNKGRCLECVIGTRLLKNS